MRNAIIIALIALSPIISQAAEDTPADSTEASPGELFSKAVGQHYAMQIAGMELDVEAVIAGIRAGGTPPPDERMQQLHAAHMAQVAQAREAAGPIWKQEQELPEATHDAFYEAFITMDGVQVTDSGLAYQILRPGDGKRPTAKDTVMVHYDGRLTTGALFDSSRERGEPLPADLSRGLIQGWKEAIPLLPVGTKARLVIPADLAYGPHDPQSQRPTGILIFDVEVMEIVNRP